jgi:hypothetical protein
MNATAVPSRREARTKMVKQVLVALGGLIGVPTVLVLVIAPIVYGLYEDTRIGHDYQQYFAANPAQIPVQLTQVATLHIQTAFAVSQTVLAIALVIATAVYVSVTRTARDDARASRAADHDAEQRAADREVRVADALERIATATEANAAHAGTASQIRAVVALTVGWRPDSGQP